MIRDANQEQLTKSKNPFALAVLAASYLNQAHKDAKQLYDFKVKLYELARDKGYIEHQIEALIRFIFLLIILPKKEKKKFEKLVYKTQNIENMSRPTMTEYERESFESFAAIVYEATFGVSFEDVLKQKEAEKQEEIARKEAEKQEEIARKEAEKQEEIAQALLRKGDYSVREIAEITRLSQYKVRKLKKQLEEDN